MKEKEFCNETLESVQIFCSQEREFIKKALDLALKIKSMDVSDNIKNAIENEIDLLLDMLSKINEYEKSFE